ncbi:MAG: glycosyltransferase [Spirulinaceae cyanobacterium]
MQQTSRETSWGKVIFKQEIREKVPSSVKRIALLVTPEYEGIFRNGGIGSYYRTLSEKLAAADFYVVLLLAQSKERFGGGSTIAVVDQIFSLSECEEVLELPSTHSGILSQFREWEWVGYENYGALFFAQAIATQFKDAYIYIEFPEMLGLGYRTIQAKRAGILGKNCVVAVTLHSGQEWLQEAHGSYLQVNPQWFWQVSHYEQYCFEQADLAFFLSHFLQEKVERYGWQTNHAWHLPYCFPVLAQASPVTTMTEDLQHLVKEDKIPVVFFGRLEERKGLLYFLEALELLEDSVTEKVQVIFLGKNVSLQTSGLQGLDSQDYIKETLGQSYQYSIVTDLFSQEAIELIRQLNSPLVCLTSKQENFPHAALEMAQLPMSLVVADAGGFQETLNLVERSLGVHWFAPQDAYSLAQALLKAISLYPEKLEVPTREFLDDTNQKLLRQRWEYMGLTFEETVMSFESHSDKTQPRQWILGMTSMEEQLFLEDYAQNEYSGKGEIVELGCWLGSSTISLARGLEANSFVKNKNQRIHAYDLFIWSSDANMSQSVIGTSLESKYQDGDSFLDEYLQRIAPWRDLVEVCPGDLTEIGWQRGNIELLFVDAMKSWELTNSIIKNFFPYLVEEFSLVVHQDFAHFYTAWIHLFMYRLREYFSPVDIPSLYPSKVFRYLKQIPKGLLKKTYSFDDFSRDEVEAAFDYSMAITPGKMQPNIMAAKVMYFLHIWEFEQAILEFRKSISQLNSDEWLELLEVQRVAKMYYSIDLL